jgi:hypothetical protein
MSFVFAVTVTSRSEEVSNDLRPNPCSVESYVRFIDDFLSRPTINAYEFEQKLNEQTPKCSVDVAEVQKNASQSKFFQGTSRAGKYVTFAFRSRVNGQDFRVTFSVDQNTGRIVYSSGGHHSL